MDILSTGYAQYQTWCVETADVYSRAVILIFRPCLCNSSRAALSLVPLVPLVPLDEVLCAGRSMGKYSSRCVAGGVDLSVDEIWLRRRSITSWWSLSQEH